MYLKIYICVLKYDSNSNLAHLYTIEVVNRSIYLQTFHLQVLALQSYRHNFKTLNIQQFNHKYLPAASQEGFSTDCLFPILLSQIYQVWEKLPDVTNCEPDKHSTVWKTDGGVWGSQHSVILLFLWCDSHEVIIAEPRCRLCSCRPKLHLPSVSSALCNEFENI